MLPSIKLLLLIFAAYFKKVTDLKVNKYHIIRSWILLICFITGQYMVYAHQHKLIQGAEQTHSVKQQQPKQTLTEKCQLCDAMHHNSMVNHSVSYFTPVVITDHFYKKGQYNFVSIALILSAGRSPPLS